MGDQPLDESRSYCLATTDYLASGQNGYSSLVVPDDRVAIDAGRGTRTLDIVTEYLSGFDQVAPKVEGRTVALQRQN